jgi:hypothetical protein
MAVAAGLADGVTAGVEAAFVETELVEAVLVDCARAMLKLSANIKVQLRIRPGRPKRRKRADI